MSGRAADVGEGLIVDFPEMATTRVPVLWGSFDESESELLPSRIRE